MKIVIACGGTGGHLFPGLAVAEVLRARGHEVLLLVSEKEIDSLALRGQEELAFERIASVGMPRIFSPAILGFGLRFLGGLRQCRAIYKRFKPDALLGMGGFTSTGPALAAKLAGVPVFIHESNAIPGKANLLNARFARMVLLGVEECVKFFPNNTTRVTGTPIRSDLKKRPDREQVLKEFGFNLTKPVLLVMGGSQGARGLNEAVIKTLPVLKELHVQVVHLAGGYDESMAAEACRFSGITARVSAFHHKMEELYTIADLAVARSGAASLAELCWFALPSVLLPYPHAAEDHQTRNAEIMARAGASELLPECDAVEGRLGTLLTSLLKNPDRLKSMSEAARKLSPTDAAGEVAGCIEEFLKH